jgi:hypothetical protein
MGDKRGGFLYVMKYPSLALPGSAKDGLLMVYTL